MNITQIIGSFFKKDKALDTVFEEDVKTLNFVSVDFETMTADRTSACSIGLVRVCNGVISQEFYSLIKPIPDERMANNSFINGITEEMVKDAPTFKDLFPFICNFVDGLPIVCHNASMDINVFLRCMEYYNLTGLSLDYVIDTYRLYKKGLSECCKDESISFGDHHNALADAEACAKLYLCYNKCPVCFQEHTDEEIKRHYSSINYEVYQPRRVTTSNFSSQKENTGIKNKSTVFYGKSVVITGVFDKYPLREELAETLWGYGSIIRSGISRKTDIVVVGDDAGPIKLKKIEELVSLGCDIQVIEKEELYSILKKTKNN